MYVIVHAHKPKCSRDELQQLISDYQDKGTAELQEQLVLRFTPLVESLAKKFARGQISFEDLVQVGMIGLLAALHRFDKQYGRTFESFAIPTIVGEMKRYVRDKTWSVHVPRRIKELNPKIKRAVDELTVWLQRSPHIADIAAYLGVTEEEVLETLEMGRNYHSLSIDSELEADCDGNTVSLLELVGNEEEGFHEVERHLMLNHALDVLDQREKAIIHLTFYQNLSQKQAGDLLGMSQMHVSRLQRRALGKMREALRVERYETAK
jgi:RNA polymerase sigma-B factor